MIVVEFVTTTAKSVVFPL